MVEPSFTAMLWFGVSTEWDRASNYTKSPNNQSRNTDTLKIPETVPTASQAFTHLSAHQTWLCHFPQGTFPVGPTGDAWCGTQRDCGSEQTGCGTTGTACANPPLHHTCKRKWISALKSPLIVSNAHTCCQVLQNHANYSSSKYNPQNELYSILYISTFCWNFDFWWLS